MVDHCARASAPGRSTTSPPRSIAPVAEPPGYPTDQLAADINELQAELLRADGQQHAHAAEDVA